MSADTAPAAMPGEIERAFNLAARAMQRRFGASGNEEDIEAALSEFFAPILAEKERLAALVSSSEAERYRSCGDLLDRALAAEAALAAERERLVGVVEDVCAPPPTDFAGMELEAFHRGADAMNEAIAAAIRAQGE